MKSGSKLVAGLAGLALIVAACGSSATASPTAPARPSTSVDSTASPEIEPAASPEASATAEGSPLPEGPVTVATFGDSLTQGDCDDSGQGYPGRLALLIEALRPGSKVTNVGHSGWTSGDLANTANDPASEIARAIDAKPTVALVWIGSNDLWALYENGPEPMTDAAEREDLTAYEANLDVVLGRLSERGAATYVALLDDQSKRPVVAAPPDPSQPAFPATTAADRARMSAHVKAMNDVIRRKAAQYHAVTVDFFDTDVFTSAPTLCGDGNHPNANGYDAIAAIWFAALEPALR